MSVLAALLGLLCALALGVVGIAAAATWGVLAWVADAVYDLLGGDL